MNTAKTRIIALSLIALSAGLITYTVRMRQVPPVDLRDAVADSLRAPELNTDVQAAVNAGADVPVPAPSAAVPPANPLGNFGVVSPYAPGFNEVSDKGVIYRGGSLDNEAAYAFLRDIGVSATVNLQSSHPADQARCAKYGLSCRDFGILPFDNLSLSKSAEFKNAFGFVIAERKAGHKVYIHCMKGKDRTGALAAALIIREKACDGGFDKAALHDLIDGSLKEHHFWLKNYPKWHAEIMSWVDDFDGNKGWVCK